MNRIIKFRVWNKAWNKMQYSPLALDTSFLNGLFNDERFEFMQFTGLHDKNGKEIYEGDVVHGYEIYDDERYIISGEVKFEDGHFFVYDTDFFLWHYDNIEVVGNIWEQKTTQE